MHREKINIVWLKRDLRLNDHAPFREAISAKLPLLIVYFFEPSVTSAPDADVRHWRFVYQSLQEMRGQLDKYGSDIYFFHREVRPVFDQLQQAFDIHTVYSYQETGNAITYRRDIAFQQFCKDNGISWREFQSNGIIRGLRNRDHWSEKWISVMALPQAKPQWLQLKPSLLSKTLYEKLRGEDLPSSYQEKDNAFQPGGERFGWHYLKDFLDTRAANYTKSISKPLASRRGCSRISPYLAFGNLSMRQVYQALLAEMESSSFRRALANFQSRLFWHCHFIQKFEMEERMEFENLNRGFDSIRTDINPELVRAWEEGRTGFPLIDACMRCVRATGYLNFRMRALLVSFLTHHLWQPWQAGVHHLARQFLDYEPGIHYPQFQMQAGVMGVNTFRIYNPVKQSQDHDPMGEFIYQWLPELRNIPSQLVHAPSQLGPIEQQSYDCIIGKDYPAPIVDHEAAARHARKELWEIAKSASVLSEKRRILARHVNPDRRSRGK